MAAKREAIRPLAADWRKHAKTVVPKGRDSRGGERS